MRKGIVVDAEYVRSILSYDMESGKIYWISESCGGFKKSVVIHRAGDEAGCKRKPDGRVVVRIDDVLYMRYRVAWLIVHGEWPDGEIDHIDCDATNDRLSNLRVVTRKLNQENIRVARLHKSSSQYLGVYKNKKGRSKPWIASISTGGRQTYLGAYDTELEAYEAYVKAKREIHGGCTI